VVELSHAIQSMVVLLGFVCEFGGKERGTLWKKGMIKWKK